MVLRVKSLFHGMYGNILLNFRENRVEFARFLKKSEISDFRKKPKNGDWE